MKEKELHLWLQVKNDHRPAFNDLYRQSIEWVHLYGTRFTNDQELVKECIQEVYIELWTKREQIDIKVSFRFYLLKTFRRALLKKLRDRRKTEIIEFDVGMVSVPGKEEKIISTEEKNKKNFRLQEATKSLTPRQQEALYLKFHQQLDSPSIAEVMGLQTTAVYKLISTALIRLRKHF